MQKNKAAPKSSGKVYLQFMDFLDKDLGVIVNNSSFSGIKIKKLQVCPYCGFGTDSIQQGDYITRYNEGDNEMAVILSLLCTHCRKRFLTVNSFNKSSKENEFICSCPSSTAPEYKNEQIEKISPRFISLYNQSLRAEHNGDIDLAGFGMRSALETLVKDYAVEVLKIDENTVAKTSLCDCIGNFLGNKDLISTADVVRILGNDYVHAQKKYPEHDFEVLKRYMDIFISLIDVQLKIKFPPVARKEAP